MTIPRTFRCSVCRLLQVPDPEKFWRGKTECLRCHERVRVPWLQRNEFPNFLPIEFVRDKLSHKNENV
jgi:hypothetical protein